MNGARTREACLKASQEIPWGNGNIPTFTLDRQIARARKDMGEARWAELQREWDGPDLIEGRG